MIGQKVCFAGKVRENTVLYNIVNKTPFSVGIILKGVQRDNAAFI